VPCLVAAAGCSDSPSQTDRWLENGVLTDLPIDLVQALRHERIAAELRVMGLADGFIAGPSGRGWESAVSGTDSAVTAFREAADDDEVVRGIYSDALAQFDRLDVIRREVDDMASVADGLNLPGHEVTQDYTAMLEAFMGASGVLAIEVDDPELAMGVELWMLGFRQHEAAEALFRVHHGVLTGDAEDGGGLMLTRPTT
jgi:hypothetical protein